MGEALETLLISAADQKRVFSRGYSDAIGVVENGLIKKNKGKVVLPDKISVIFDEKKQNRINCMPGALLDDKLYGMKWVAVFPDSRFFVRTCKWFRYHHSTVLRSKGYGQAPSQTCSDNPACGSFISRAHCL